MIKYFHKCHRVYDKCPLEYLWQPPPPVLLPWSFGKYPIATARLAPLVCLLHQ